MAEHDPLSGLTEIADAAAREARPLPAGEVRRLGTHRRRRRQALTSVVAAAVLVVGGAAIASQTGLRADVAPNPVATPSAAPTTGTTSTATPKASASASRTVTQANLLTAPDIGSIDNNRRVEEWSQNARPIDQLSVCQQPMAELGATSMVSRSFAVGLPDPPASTSPLAKVPNVYVVALQFADEQAATKAVRTFSGWVDDCGATLRKSTEFAPIGDSQGMEWFAVTTSGKSDASFTQVPLYRFRGDRSEDGFFETVGLTLLGDRVMLTVDLTYGNEKHTSYTEGGDPTTELPEDIQFDLIRASARTLAR